jgi:two-component system chemotaxis response regulator CheB
MIKVLIVEDSKTVSQYLEFILSNDPDIEVIGNVENGKLAINFIQENKPDIITMDIDMPVMNGLEATREIMSSFAIPIIVVTASKNAHDKDLAMDALALGALTIVNKPVGIGHPQEEEKSKKLILMIKTYSQVKVVKRNFNIRNKRVSKIDDSYALKQSLPPIKNFLNRKFVAIGVSTGGPPLLENIFSKISQDFPYPILIVQHIAIGFLENMVSWLNRSLSIPVFIASDNEKLLPGNIYFAPDNFHLGVDGDYAKLQKNESNSKICPSASYLFSNLASKYGKETIALILTGMGRDGAIELKDLYNSGAITIAQDKESSLIHGMPGEAIKLGGVTHVLNTEQITQLLHSIEKTNKNNIPEIIN